MPLTSDMACGHWIYMQGGVCKCPNCQPFAECPPNMCCRNDGVICPDDTCDRALEIYNHMENN